MDKSDDCECNASQDERQTHDRLCHVVARYSGLPLRDLSNSTQIPDAEASEEQASVVHGNTSRAVVQRERRERGWRPWLGCLSFLLLTGSVLLLALAGVILQRV